MLPFEFPEDEVRWNPDSGCIEFGVIVGEYKGTVLVPALVFKRFLGQPVSPEKCFEAFHLHRMQFEQAVEAKILRREISKDGNIELLARDLPHRTNGVSRDDARHRCTIPNPSNPEE